MVPAGGVHLTMHHRGLPIFVLWRVIHLKKGHIQEETQLYVGLKNIYLRK